MKGYFQTTLPWNRTTPQNALISSIPSINEPYSLMYIPKPLPAYTPINRGFSSSKPLLNYIFITLYLKEIN